MKTLPTERLLTPFPELITLSDTSCGRKPNQIRRHIPPHGIRECDPRALPLEDIVWGSWSTGHFKTFFIKRLGVYHTFPSKLLSLFLSFCADVHPRRLVFMFSYRLRLLNLFPYRILPNHKRYESND